MANDKPLAPRTEMQPLPIFLDEELSMELKKQRKSFRKCTICCGIITAILLIISVIMLILSFTALHVKNPKINMNSVSIIGLDQVNVTTNLTVVANVSVKNTNVAAFQFEKSNSSLLYHDMIVGLADIPPGVAKARRTLRLNVTFDVMVAEIMGKQEFPSDLATGILPFESYTKINGRVKILNIIKRKVTVTMNCSIAVNVTSGVIVDQDCKKHVLTL